VKKGITFLVAVCALLATAPSYAQAPFSLYGGGFMSFPSSPGIFKDQYKNGYHLMAGLGLKSAPGLQIVPKIEYHRFGRDYSFGNLTDVSGGSEAMWLYGLDFRLGPTLPGVPLHPYVLVGGGLSRVTHAEFTGLNSTLVNELNANLPNEQSRFYYNVGAGFDIAFLPPINLFLQVRYVSVATEGSASRFVPITVGVKVF
jgi:hypothetical protein